MTDLDLELIIAGKTIRKAEETFDQLREDDHALREHTDKLETILKEHDIPSPVFWGIMRSLVQYLVVIYSINSCWYYQK